MNLALLLPIGLAALAALLLPLLVHLARRSEHRPTVFAALQWLRRKPKPRHRIRFDEWPLLLVRLLLLALLALLLARPVLHGAQDDAPWVAVAPGVEVPRDRASIAPADARWHRLAPGFPALDGAAPARAVPDGRGSITSLLRELDATLPPGVALTVLVPPVLDGVDAQRPVLSRAVDWKVLPADAAVDASGAADAALRARAERATATLDARSESQSTRATRSADADDAANAPRESSSARVTERAPPPSIRFAAERESALRYLRAALAAWTPGEREPAAGTTRVAHDIAPLDAPLPAPARDLVWLAPGAVPPAVCDWIRAGGTVLLDAQAVPCAAEPAVAGPHAAGPSIAVWRDDAGAPLVEAAAHGRGRMLRFTRPLTPQAMPELLDGAFPTRLRALFEPAPAAPARVPAAEHVPSTGGPAYAQPLRDLAPWLVVLIALVFLVERTMATARRRGAAP